ncbi:MAG: BACON domain-containing protein [Bacteroidales bacterium]|nr:BACON domain-containing protein [Bacteroidales bacterium]
MRTIRILALCLAAFLLPFLTACEREDPSITFDNTSLEMLAAGGSQSVSLTTNYDWTATASDPWIQVSPSSGSKGTTTLNIRVDASDKSTARKGAVNVTCRELVRGITINQLPSLSQTLVIKHTNPTFRVPSFTGSSLSGMVKWGDGLEEKYSSTLTHTYTSAGSHTVEINASGAYSFKLESIAGVTEIDFLQF